MTVINHTSELEDVSSASKRYTSTVITSDKEVAYLAIATGLLWVRRITRRRYKGCDVSSR